MPRLLKRGGCVCGRMIRAMQRLNNIDVRDPRQTLDYRGGTYRNMWREFFCLSPVDSEDEAEQPAAPEDPPPPPRPCVRGVLVLGPNNAFSVGVSCRKE